MEFVRKDIVLIVNRILYSLINGFVKTVFYRKLMALHKILGRQTKKATYFHIWDIKSVPTLINNIMVTYKNYLLFIQL